MKTLLAFGAAALLLASAVTDEASARAARAGGVTRTGTVHGGARAGYAGRVGRVGVARGGYYGRGVVGRPGYGWGVAAGVAAVATAAAYGTYGAPGYGTADYSYAPAGP